MPIVLQLALFLASIAIVVFVAFCIPAIVQLRQQANQMTQTLTELKAEVSLLVQDSRTVLARVQGQCVDVEQVLHTVRGWTNRVDRVMDEVGAAVEPPVLAVARNAQVVYRGIAKFFQTFLNRNQPQPQKEEEHHVRY